MYNIIYNPGEYNYRNFIEYNEYYIDKTNLIIELNKNVNSIMRYICVSLPKHFGKTVITDMLVAYYSFSKSKIISFDDKMISESENWDKYLGKFNVIRLNMLQFFRNKNINDGIKKIKKLIIYEVKIYDQNFECNEEEDIDLIIYKIYRSTKRKIVLVIDEWDIVLRDKKYNVESKIEYLDFLNLLIINDKYLALTYMTGILPIQNYEINLNFNVNFNEFTMKSPGWMAKYIGINDDDVKELCHKHLNDRIQNSSNKKQKVNNGSFNKIDKNGETNKLLSHKNNDNEKKDEETFYKDIKDFYNGYQLIDELSGEKYKVYSPYSVIEAIKIGKINNYQMDNKDFLYEFIQENFYNLKYVILLLMENKNISIESLNFQNDKISFEERKSNLIKLVNMGYLGYDSSKNEIFIPNNEMREIFEIFIQSKNYQNLNKKSVIFNPGEDNYRKFSKNKYFIDKTKLIFLINNIIIDTENSKNICVTRPRRFGKTVTVNMITAYYSFSESKITVFDDKKISEIENWDKYLGKFNVINLNMLQFFIHNNINNGINKIKKSIIEAVKITNRKIFLIIDEWDIILRDDKHDTESKKKYLNFLTLLIKDNEFIVLTYMTGILPIKNYGLNSNLRGVFDEFTMISNNYIAEYVGFTDDDIEELCKKYLSEQILENSYENQNLIHEDIYKNKDIIISINYEMIKDWYNGYQLINNNDGKEYNIYTPYSVIKAIKNKRIENYWIKTESNLILFDFINKNLDGLKEDVVLLMNNEKLYVNTNAYKSDINFVEYQNKDAILTILIHLGYLAYNSKSKKIYIPNKEINTEFKDATNNKVFKPLFDIINESEKLLKATWNMKENVVAELLEKIHDSYSNRDYNNESTLRSAIKEAYLFARVFYTVFEEIDSGKGFADVFFIPYNPDKPAMVVELKHNKTTNTGIKQIKKLNYPARLVLYKDNLLLVSINYDNKARIMNQFK
ncbi:hypothetical protein PIROE2DRAFT_18009 [Piromyces sp. E2]|nr:hypothetical protein PIROE2DRAFT_18009 [Piromyces sp. E2]|eukprot:OUM57108.1 hypothetical protein PIROE2DRAFT_18009 [Piromyces sp. E2]